MNNTVSLQRLSASAMLIAIGVIIPMFSPIKIVLEPASFTLASHVAIFIAMLIAPNVAVAVSIGTAAGFLLGGFPVVIVARAATHVIFAFIGAFYLTKHMSILKKPVYLRVFSLAIGLIHAIAEVAAVSFMYFSNQMGQGYYQSGFLHSVLLMVGVGTVVHSMVDFEIAILVAGTLKRQKSLSPLFPPA